MTDDKFTLEDVFKAYFECRKNKRNTCNALLFEKDYQQKCVQLHKELTEGTYEIGRSIAFLVTRPKLREVFAADFRDRIVHHLVIGRLEPLFEDYFIDDCYNCRKGKGTLYGVKRLHQQIEECSEHYTKDCYIFKGDMQGFFMSIHKPTLWEMLQVFIEKRYKGSDKAQLLWLTEKIVMHSPEKNCIIKGRKDMWSRLPPNKSLFTCGEEYGLPIGNLTSQMFANFYLSEFDHWVKSQFQYYGRYVDDFYIVDTNKARLLDVIPHIRDKLKMVNVTLHPRKLYLQHYSKGVSFTGAVSKMNRLYISNRTISSMEGLIDEMNEADESRKEEFTSRMNSYLGFLRHYNSYGLRRRLLRRIDKRWWKHYYITDKHRTIKTKQLW